MTEKTNQRPSFATMSPEKRRQVAGEGGREAHRRGVGHEWTSEGAREAARRSTEVRRAKRDARVACEASKTVAAEQTPTPPAAVTAAADHYGRRFE